jgi:hypothetical protein
MRIAANPFTITFLDPSAQSSGVNNPSKKLCIKLIQTSAGNREARRYRGGTPKHIVLCLNANQRVAKVYISKPSDVENLGTGLLVLLTNGTGVKSINNQIQADHFAKEGYFVVMPDLFVSPFMSLHVLQMMC